MSSDKNAVTGAPSAGKCTPQSEEMLLQAARIASLFVLLERSLIDLAYLLLDAPPEIARAVTTDMTLDGIQTLTHALTKVRLPEFSEKLRTILKLVEQAEYLKTGVSHHFWGHRHKPGERAEIKCLHRFRATYPDLNSSDLYNIATKIGDTGRELELFRKTIQQALKEGCGKPQCKDNTK